MIPASYYVGATDKMQIDSSKESSKSLKILKRGYEKDCSKAIHLKGMGKIRTNKDCFQCPFLFLLSVSNWRGG